MAIVSFVEEGLGNSSYLVELGDGRALVVDPPRDVSAHREAAEGRGLRIAYAIETHLHADFVSGSRELAAAGSTIVGARAARLEFPHRGLDGGEEIDLGGLTLRAVATPGHTPEHLAYVLLDGARPLALFSGGALLPGSVARTDLTGAEQTESLARALYRALRDGILSLPDDLPVYPTHGGGSFCSLDASGERTTTIGRERASNPLLAAPGEDAFVERLLATFGSYPTYFRRLRDVNRRGPRVYGGLPTLEPLGLDEVDRLLADGAELVDVRPLDAFAAAHVPRSLSIALRSAFASWLGWLVPDDRPLVFVLDAGQDRRDLVRQCLLVGYERLAGELAGGIEAWRDAGRPLASTSVIRMPDAARGPIVDVRQASEYRAGHVPDAAPVELGSLAGGAAGLIPAGATIMCGHGERAMSAASLAERDGIPSAVFVGGPDRWSRRTGTPLVTG